MHNYRLDGCPGEGFRKQLQFKKRFKQFWNYHSGKCMLSLKPLLVSYPTFWIVG